MAFSWSGCAAGAGARALCTIKDPGRVTATVTVDDGHGHTVAASAVAAGEAEPNSPPSVTVAFAGAAACAPSRAAPCTLEVIAQAADLDGDTLRYSWSGCAAGAGQRAVCAVAAPGTVAVTVTVDDGHDHIVRASASALGINRPPDVSISAGFVPALASGEIDFIGSVIDPDDGFLCGAEYCGVATTTGACGRADLRCTCLAGLDLVVLGTAAAGTCTITLEVKDTWGTVGRPVLVLDVATLQILSHSRPLTTPTAVPQTVKR